MPLESSSSERPAASPKTLSKPAVLVVEGAQDVDFFRSFLNALGIDSVSIWHTGGKYNTADELDTLKDASGFRDNVRSLGIVRDADDNPKGAFDSVCSALKGVGLAVPNKPGEMAVGTPNVAVHIIHPQSKPGTLETLCLEALAAVNDMSCVDAYFQCLREANIELPDNVLPKAHLQVLLAAQMESKDKSGLWLSIAVKRPWWPWDSPAFDPARAFLRQVATAAEG